MSDEMDKYRQWDASYVLGALSPADRREFEIHLASCEECTRAVADVASIPGFLMKLDKDQAIALVDPPQREEGIVLPLQPLSELARKAAAKRKRARFQISSALSAAAAVVIAASLSIGSLLGHSSNGVVNDSGLHSIVMKPMVSNAMQVDLQVSPKAWGTRFVWTCKYPKDTGDSGAPEKYDLVVYTAEGSKLVVATWTESGSIAKGLIASTEMPLSKVKMVQVQSSDNHEAISEGII